MSEADKMRASLQAACEAFDAEEARREAGYRQMIEQADLQRAMLPHVEGIIEHLRALQAIKPDERLTAWLTALEAQRDGIQAGLERVAASAARFEAARARALLLHEQNVKHSERLIELVEARERAAGEG